MEIRDIDDALRRAKKRPKHALQLAMLGVVAIAVIAFLQAYFSSLGERAATGNTGLEGYLLLNQTVAESELIKLALEGRLSPNAVDNLKMLANAGLIQHPGARIRSLPSSKPVAPGLSASITGPAGERVVYLSRGEVGRYKWTSSGATACSILTPTGLSGISLAGVDDFSPEHPWYPPSGSVRALALDCTDGQSTAGDVLLLVGRMGPFRRHR